MRRRLCVPVLLSLLLCACAPLRNEDARATAYRCSNGGIISARYLPDGGSAVLFLPDRTLTLPRAPSGSGTRYSDGTFTLLSVGEEARVEFGQTALYEGCRAVRFGPENTPQF
jgi:membrane-bound inhibitor of C-type lysozyme